MSLASKITFATCCITSVSIITYVHVKQNMDRYFKFKLFHPKYSFEFLCNEYFRQKLKEGILKDVERQHMKTVNTYNLQKQKDLTKILRKEQEQNEIGT